MCNANFMIGIIFVLKNKVILYSIFQTPASEIYNCNKLLFSQIPKSAPDSYSYSGNHSIKFLELPLIVDVNVRLNQAVTAIFRNIIRDNFEFPEAWVCTSRLDHHLLD